MKTYRISVLDFTKSKGRVLSTQYVNGFSARGSLRDMQLFVREWKAACI